MCVPLHGNQLHRYGSYSPWDVAVCMHVRIPSMPVGRFQHLDQTGRGCVGDQSHYSKETSVKWAMQPNKYFNGSNKHNTKHWYLSHAPKINLHKQKFIYLTLKMRYYFAEGKMCWFRISASFFRLLDPAP